VYWFSGRDIRSRVIHRKQRKKGWPVFLAAQSAGERVQLISTNDTRSLDDGLNSFSISEAHVIGLEITKQSSVR